VSRPRETLGMRHVALSVRDLEACERFYVDLLGMHVEWRPDADNLYLSSGSDNLALHREYGGEGWSAMGQRLDHIGFFLGTPDEVDRWFAFLRDQGVRMRTEPRTHRDGARSFYCFDPDGTVVQLIYHPPVLASEREGRA